MVNKHLSDSERVAYQKLVNEYSEKNIAVKQPDFYNVENKEFYEVKKVSELKNKDNVVYFGKKQYEELEKINPYIMCIKDNEIYGVIKLRDLEENNIVVRKVFE